MPAAEERQESCRANTPQIPDHSTIQRIGRGAYGEVWLARSVTGAARAVKVVWRESFDHARTYEREFEGLKKFEPISRGNESLVDILHIGRNDAEGYFYCVMELADNAAEGGEYVAHTVAERIRREGALTVMESARIGAAMADALGYMHGHGLVHRDVKPSNIIFVNGQPKLADIGLVARVGEARSFVGTDGFIPPEGPGAPRGDIYALGKSLYEMATGQSRLDFPDLPRRLGEADDGGLFVELNEIILRACAAEPEGRHACAEEMRGELLLIDAGKSIRRLRRNERLLKRWRRAAMATFVVVAIAGAAFWIERERRKSALREADAQVEQRRIVEGKERVARENLYAADMNLAQQAIEAGNYGRAEALLGAYAEAGADDLRGFEWYHFWQKARGDSIAVLRGHGEVVSSMVLTPDGERILSASFDSTVREWSLGEKRELRRWALPGCLFMAVALNADGTLLGAEGGNRRYSGVLDLRSGAWTTNVSTVSPSIAFAPGGEKLLRGANTLLFDTNGVVEVTDLKFNVERVLAEAGGRVAVAPNGRLIATGSWGDWLKLWNWPHLEMVGELEGAGVALAMSFSPDSSRLATVTRAGQVMVWDVANRKLLATRNSHNGATIWSVAFSRDGKRLATGGNDQTVRAWNAETLEEEHIFRGHGSEVWAVVWSHDGEQLISSGKDATIRIWDATPEAPPLQLKDIVGRPLFSGDGKHLSTRDRAGAVVIDLGEGEVALRIPNIAEIAAVTNGSVACLGSNWEWQERSIADGGVLRAKNLEDPGIGFTKRIISRSGRWIATGFKDGRVVLHDAEGDGKGRLLSSHQEMIVSFAFSPDETKLLTGAIDRTARLWDLARGKMERVFGNHKMGLGSVAFSPDGKLIATGSWDDTVHVWEAATGNELMVLDGHQAGVQAVEFAPDGRTLASLSGANVMKFWNLPARREAGQLKLPHGVRQGWLGFSEDGKWLAAVSQAEVLTLHQAPRGIFAKVR